MVEANKAFGQSCLNLTGPLLGHVDTTSAAKDIDAIRLALNQGKLNWMGFSYGSELGAAYAELYPENVGAMILDGIVDHSQSEVSNLVIEMSTYEDELNHFFDWCSNTSSCALNGQNVAKTFDELINATLSTIPALSCSGSCRVNVTAEDILFNVQDMLTYKDPVAALGNPGWPALGFAPNESIHGDTTALSSPLAIATNDGNFPGIVIGCLDWTHSDGSTFTRNKYKQQFRLALAPHTHGATQSYSFQTSCIGWPVGPIDPPRALNRAALERLAPGSVLLVNAIHDPATSYVWVQNLLAQFPANKGISLLTRDGDGHTSYLQYGAAARALEAFLVNGTVPEANTIVTS